MLGRAALHLRERDPRLGEWIDRIGVVRLPRGRSRDPFPALLEAIAHQQLAGAAAKAIWGRVLGLFSDGCVHPRRLLDLSDEALRGAGLSRGKTRCMKALAAHALAGKVPDAGRILTMPDAELAECLTEVRGIGPWTVDMLLIFTLRRPDVLPLGDYGVRKGFQILHRKRSLPTPAQLLRGSQAWRPYRSTAALYLWRIAEAGKPLAADRVTS